MNQDKLDNILTQHKLWLDTNKKEGVRADLQSANLRGTYLRGADLQSADLQSADLSGANLYRADLYRANLTGANLIRANLQSADLSEIKGKEILTFQAGKDFAYSCDGFIKIGCMEHPIEYWLNNFEEIGKDNDYTENEIKRYGGFIKYINKEEK